MCDFLFCTTSRLVVSVHLRPGWIQSKVMMHMGWKGDCDGTGRCAGCVRVHYLQQDATACGVSCCVQIAIRGGVSGCCWRMKIVGQIFCPYFFSDCWVCYERKTQPPTMIENSFSVSPYYHIFLPVIVFFFLPTESFSSYQITMDANGFLHWQISLTLTCTIVPL